MRVAEFDCILIEGDALVKYKIPRYVKLVYELLVKHIAINEGYISKVLNLPIEADRQFLVRGLILDFIHGNVLRLGDRGHIVAASHGSSPLEDADIYLTYRRRRWSVVDRCLDDYIGFLEGKLSNKLMVLLSYFEIAVGLVFIRIVDTIDHITDTKMKNYLFIYDSINTALEQVLNETDGYFSDIIKNPDYFLHKCDEATINWLNALKQVRKPLILFSNWSFDYTKHVLKFILGPYWNSLFCYVICAHKKVPFFSTTQSFNLLPDDEGNRHNTKFVVDGCYKYLKIHLQHVTDKREMKVLFLGTDFLLDTYLESKLYFQRTQVFICEEYDAESPDGLGYDPPFHKILTSKMWGPHLKSKKRDMLWGTLARRKSTFLSPGIDTLATYPLDENILYTLC